MLRLAPTILVTLAMAGCDAGTPVEQVMEDDCAAKDFAHLIGQPVEAAEAIPQPKRIIRPNEAVTFDYVPTRTNVEVDEAGIILRLGCY